MWPYKEISREGFEKVKDHIEEIMVAHGAVPFDIELPYEQITANYIDEKTKIVCQKSRRIYRFNDLYYRLDEVCFPDRPFIVAEIGTYEELMNNTMEDADPFPYNLSDEEFEDEVSYFLNEKPYPED